MFSPAYHQQLIDNKPNQFSPENNQQVIDNKANRGFYKDAIARKTEEIFEQLEVEVPFARPTRVRLK